MTTHLNEFIEWARENKIEINSVDPKYDGDNIDLKAIASTVGDDVQIVALSEGCHNNKVVNNKRIFTTKLSENVFQGLLTNLYHSCPTDILLLKSTCISFTNFL